MNPLIDLWVAQRMLQDPQMEFANAYTTKFKNQMKISGVDLYIPAGKIRLARAYLTECAEQGKVDITTVIKELDSLIREN